MDDKAIYNCKTSEEVFDLLEPLITGLQNDTKLTLENELTSNGINGESLIFFNNSYLDELNITNQQNQSIIIKAINTLYDTKVLAKYLATFQSFKAYSIDKAIIDGEINLEILKNEGHEISFYKSMLNITNDNIIQQFLSTFEMIFNHPVKDLKPISTDNKPQRVRNTGSRQSATTLPKLISASAADLNQMKQSIVCLLILPRYLVL